VRRKKRNAKNEENSRRKDKRADQKDRNDPVIWDQQKTERGKGRQGGGTESFGRRGMDPLASLSSVRDESSLRPSNWGLEEERPLREEGLKKKKKKGGEGIEVKGRKKKRRGCGP